MDPGLVVMLWFAAAAGIALFLRAYTVKRFLRETFDIPWFGRTPFQQQLAFAEERGLDVSEVLSRREHALVLKSQGEPWEREQAKAERALAQLLDDYTHARIGQVRDAIGRLPRRAIGKDTTLKEGIAEARSLVKRAEEALKSRELVAAAKLANEAAETLEDAAIDYHVERG